MRITYPDRASFGQALKGAKNESLDVIVIATGAFEPIDVADLKACLAEGVRALKSGGLLFVQGRPDCLPELGVYLDQYLHFKYWIAVESAAQPAARGLPSVHAAILLFTKGSHRFNVKRTRFLHQHCAFCKKPLRDWGGKTHLMHPDGYVISDVWTELPPANNYTQISTAVLDAILRMLDFGPRKREKTSPLPETPFHEVDDEIRGIIGPQEGIGRDDPIAGPAVEYRLSRSQFRSDDFSRSIQCATKVATTSQIRDRLGLPGLAQPTREYGDATNEVDDRMFNVVHRGDALEILKRYPDNSVDLVFADPPYNLDKQYHVYDDEQDDARYTAWCNAWLAEYARILKPSGSLYVLNLPRWTRYHAAFLNRHLYFQNWIVWDALSEPRGKLMPAHYGLLFYTKHPTDFTFNYEAISPIDARHYCLRSSCIRKRKAMGVDDQEPLTDVWWDIHRIKHRRDRDYHPCQLPEALMERIIRLSTNPGDIVLDAFSGTGTTAVAAVKLGRRYVAIDVDKEYVRITREKIAEIERDGRISRKSVPRPQREYTKKELQLELRNLAAKLGRLPTPQDVRRMSDYDVQVFFEMFPGWSKALKAAKLEVQA